MSKCTRFVGLDESKDRIEVAIADAGARDGARRYGTISNTPKDLERLVRRLGRPKELAAVYEAGPCGYETYRTLRGLGVDVTVVAPSRTPIRAGDRIKNDRRDAMNLARLHRAGELTAVWVPGLETEAIRDALRAREDGKYAETRARQRLGSFLLRHGRRYPGISHWTATHLRWIASQRFEHPAQHLALEEYIGTVEEAGQRVARFDQEIAKLVDSWSMTPVVRALMGHRGVSLIVAATVVAEIGDLTRFDRARDIMGFVGLVPSLMATGKTRRTGAITKTGNGHVRRCLIQAAWAYRHPARRTPALRRRLEGLPPEVQKLAWQTQVRLCGRYRRLRARGKHHNKIITAVARELIGFLWATARLASPPEISATAQS